MFSPCRDSAVLALGTPRVTSIPHSLSLQWLLPVLRLLSLPLSRSSAHPIPPFPCAEGWGRARPYPSHPPHSSLSLLWAPGRLRSHVTLRALGRDGTVGTGAGGRGLGPGGATWSGGGSSCCWTCCACWSVRAAGTRVRGTLSTRQICPPTPRQPVGKWGLLHPLKFPEGGDPGPPLPRSSSALPSSRGPWPSPLIPACLS
jgi:hypothetical protein